MQTRYWGGDIPWISAKSLKHFYVSDSADRVTESGAEAIGRVPSGTVLFVVRGMSLANEFRVGVTKREVTFNQDVRALVPASDIDGRYLARFLQAHESEILTLVDEASHGTKRLTSDRFHEIQVPLPSLQEQRRIAAILDKADALRARRRAALAQLDTLTQAIFVEMFGDPAVNSKGWARARLGEVIHSVSDGPHISPNYVSAGVPFLSTRNIRAGAVSWTDLKFISEPDAENQWRKCRPTRGDILYTKGGTTGLAAAVETDRPFAVWVHVALLKPNSAVVDFRWLEGMLNTSWCYAQSQRLTHGIANRDLGLTRIVNITIYLPPLHLQRDFVKLKQRIRGVSEMSMSSCETMEALFTSLLHRAFRGEL